MKNARSAFGMGLLTLVPLGLACSSLTLSGQQSKPPCSPSCQKKLQLSDTPAVLSSSETRRLSIDQSEERLESQERVAPCQPTSPLTTTFDNRTFHSGPSDTFTYRDSLRLTTSTEFGTSLPSPQFSRLSARPCWNRLAARALVLPRFRASSTASELLRVRLRMSSTRWAPGL